MSVSIKTSALLASCWLWSNIYFVIAKKPDCMAAESPPPEIFSSEHYKELGLTRDVCAELARFLHKHLPLTKRNPFCHSLARLITSACFPCLGCTKTLREGASYSHRLIVKRALLMFQNFNNEVWLKNKLSKLEDRELLREKVRSSVTILTEAGVKDTNPDLIQEINRFGFIFCQNPKYNPISPPVSQSPVYYIYRVHEKIEFEEMVLKKTEPVVANFPSAYGEYSQYVLTSIMEKVVRKHEGKVYFANISFSQDSSIGKDYNVEDLPTIISFKNGIEIDRLTDAQEETDIDNLVTKLLNLKK